MTSRDSSFGKARDLVSQRNSNAARAGSGQQPVARDRAEDVAPLQPQLSPAIDVQALAASATIDGQRSDEADARSQRLAQLTSGSQTRADGQADADPLAPGVPGLPTHGPTLPSGLSPLPAGISTNLPPVLDETVRWGRDDIKRLEMGSQGENISFGVGGGLGHLVGLGDEEPGRRNGEKLLSGDNSRFPGESNGVGTGIDHLWLLGDFEYTRASTDDPEEDVFRNYDASAPSFGPLAADAMFFRMVEDNGLTGRIFDAANAILPVTQRSIEADPVAGTVVFNQNGTFAFTPANGFSGETEVRFSFTDPRTGIVETGIITIVVEAVADPASIEGAAATPEDVRIGTPVTVTLNDPDGSEEIEQVVITGLPAGAMLHWNTALPGSIVLQPDGSFLVTGSTPEIQDLLASLEVTPPADFDGRITLGIDVTTIEANVDPELPGFEDRETVHFDYHIDVEAVADPVTATGDDEVTDEDVAVHLDDLAATFGDLLDGSETHVVEIRGVDPDAKLQDALGAEYPFTIAGDGTKTYTLTSAQVADVYFLPPPDESGLFSGMTIVAIATEGANADEETASAPITVLVDPVADPLDITAPSQATDEDTPVTFGDDITIAVNDPLTQTVISVVVSGFPEGTSVTYTPVGGGSPLTIVTGAGGSVTFDGGTEQEIRNALATLALTPPPHTDQNITLSISATTEDLGGVTDTQVVPMTITVAAVADGPNIAGSALGDEDQPIALPISVTRIDADGSEQYEFAEIIVPADVTLIYSATLPDGIMVSVSGSTHTFTPGPATTAAQFESFLATGLQVQAPSDSDGNFDVDVRVGTMESVLSGGELTLERAEKTHAVPVTVRPVVDMPTVTGASNVDEDSSIDFGANITITDNDRDDGSEAITQIVLGNIPDGALVDYSTSGTVSVFVSSAGGITSYAISGGSEDDIRATLATFTLQPPLHTDQNIPVSVTVTKVDQTTSEGEAAATSTQTTTHDIAVAAVADGPTIGGTAIGDEDQPIALPITVSRIDADGSEQYDFAEITIPADVTLMYPAALPDGITLAVSGATYTFTPGASTTAAQFESFLATGLQVQAWPDSDENFSVDVRVGTIESVLSGGELTLERAEQFHSVPVTVRPVVDAPVISGSSSINEDGIVDPIDQTVTAAVNFGADISITAPDSSDGSEAITGIIISGLPVGAVVTYTPIGGISTTFTVTPGSTSITLGGGATEADIRAALATLSLVPPPHSDADIPLTVSVTKGDATASEAETPATQAFAATHIITVAAIADVPTVSGSGAGLEDQSIPLSITVGHPDDGDGSERIQSVVVAGVPAGFTLSEASTGAGVLTDNGGGTYTVTGPSDAAIADLLANLTLVYASGGARLHLDTDFSLSVTATTVESTPSETGVGQVAQLTTSNTFAVPVTVTAVVDGVTKSGASVIVEDLARTIGSDIQWARIDADGTEHVTSVVVSGFPIGATITYTDLASTLQTFVSTGVETITLSGPHSAATETAIRAALDTLSVQAPTHVDINFSLDVAITTTDNDASATTQSFAHTVVVQAVADAPSVAADDLSLDEDTTATLVIRPNRSADDDNSETLSVRITVPTDGTGVVGTLSAGAPAGVTFTDLGGGVYMVAATGATPALREAALDGFLNGGITFTPRAEWSGVLTGTNGIRVDAISTESATQYANTTPSPDDELAPNDSAASGTAGDLDTRIETTTTYIDITVAAAPDTPVLANASTIVQENNGSSVITDPDLVIAIGTRLGLSIADTDGSQGLSMTLTGFPTNAQALAFATSIGGVTTNVDIATGTVTISGTNANDVLAVLESLSVTLADDRDQNFTVSINGTSSDTNGVTPVSTPFSLSHAVTVQAVADTPTVDVGAATKPAVDEDSGFVTYPVTTALNDTDGSETYQSVVVEFSTPGSGAAPVVQFGTTAGVTLDNTVAGRLTLTGAAADINAAMASLQVRPGADNGEDITITVTATAIESNPAEDNNGAGAGQGGGIVGPEITVPTAQAAQTFVIPVNPVPETPSLVVPASASGTEDTSFALGAITVSSGSSDPDGSETLFVEIDTSTYPSGTVFSTGGTAVGSVVTPGWLRVPASALSALDIQAPQHYSGTINLSLRGVIVDTTLTDTVTTLTAAQTLPVTVTPDADAITPPSASVGVEDNGAVAFGAVLANTSTGIRLVDNGSGTGNNSTTETLSRVVLDFPADSPTLTYTVVVGAAVGTASVGFDAGLRTYTITSTIITGAADVGALSQADRAQAEADIRATVAGFTVTMGPTHTDLNGVVAVTATTLDVNGGLANTQDNSFNHTVRIRAVADTPTVSVVDPATGVTEDGASIALSINAGNSPDTDNSETLSVRITVPTDALGPVGTITGTPPAGVTLTHQGGGVYLVTATGASNAAREALLDGFLNGGGVAFDPRANWSGSLTGTSGLRVEAISTEAATGAELAPNSFGGADGLSATETVVDYIDIVVAPAVDAPTVKGNAVGLEDATIPIPMSVTLADQDGSESYVMRITGGVPAGAHIYGAGGAELLPQAGGPFDGQYVLSPADVAELAIRPPLNYSSPLQGDITLVTVTDVTDNSGASSATSSFTNNIVVEVQGVADQPGSRTIAVAADEDQPIELGSAILASAGDSPEDPDLLPDLQNLLADRDSSEQLSFVIGGLPAGVIPTSGVPGGVTYIGGGTWSVTAAAMPTLTLPPVPNFSGENPYSGVTVRAVTQELDGDQATSPPWDVTIAVSPVINASTIDGFSSWGLGANVTEADNEISAVGISLASVASHAFVDDDGSERVVSYTFDLSSLIADAGIAVLVENLLGAGAGLGEIIGSGLIAGTFTYDSGAGTITVLAADIADVELSSSLFLDSNQDFAIPVEALVRDTAIIGGLPVSVEKIETGSFAVDLIGTADVPTVIASGGSGNSGTPVPIALGGASTDTDVALGRALSEDIFYVLRTTNQGAAPIFGLVDSGGNIIGLDIGNGSFLLTPAEIGDVRVLTPPGVGGTIELELTTVATENDGDRATNSAPLTVIVTPLAGSGPGTAPLPPTVNVGASNGNEDGSITLVVTAEPAPTDTTSPAVSVVISGLPAGATVNGATLLPPVNVGDPPRWVASAAAVNGGLVSVVPPADFSGTMSITVEGIARNANLQSATTGPQPLPVDVDPVADGVAITAVPASGIEDVAVALNISLAERDVDGNEDIGGFVYVSLDNGATLVGGYPQVSGIDPDASIDGTSLVGSYRVPASAVATLQALPAPHWHGTFTATVAAYSVEPTDDNDGDNIQLDISSFAVSVTAVADAPDVTAPVSVSGIEDTAIAITGLSASLVDTVTANGAEVLSVVISGVPDGSRFSDGSNNGDGSWTIPVAALPTLSLTPPLHYSGTMSLTMTAISLELVNGDEATASIGFDVIVASRADTVEILADNVSVGANAEAALDLSVRMADDTGTSPGESSAELIRITFTAVPTGVSMLAGAGGSVTNPSSGTWVFLGTEAQSNAISAFAGPGSSGGVYTINLSAVTIDGADTLATPVTDSFQLTVPQVMNGGIGADMLTGGAGTQLIYGLGGSDVLSGGNDDDFIAGGIGADTLTGGSGVDTFAWLGGEIGTGVDSITGFIAGAGGDALDVSRLLTGFDADTSALSDFVRLTTGSGNTTVSVDANGGGDSFQSIAVLQGVTGLDVNTMRANANLIV